jgi:hypothetical protein
VYLLHFDKPYRHYLGWAADLDARLSAHSAGNGGRLMAVIKAAGIGYQLARTWEGADRYRERELKKRHNAPRLCPICSAPPQPARPQAEAAQLTPRTPAYDPEADPWGPF